MHVFTDLQGRKWEVVITAATVRRVRGHFPDVYLPALFEKKLQPLGALFEDVPKFVDVLWLIVEKQAGQQKIDAEAFAEGLAGAPLEQAGDAFLQALIDFFHPAKAKSLRELAGKAKTAMARIQQHAEAEVAGVDPEKIADQLMSELRSSSGNALASSVSIPPPLVSASSSE